MFSAPVILCAFPFTYYIQVSCLKYCIKMKITMIVVILQFFTTFSFVKYHIYPLNKSKTMTSCPFYTVKVLKVRKIASDCKRRQVIYCMQFLRFDRKTFRNQRKYMKIPCFFITNLKYI